MGGKKLIHEVCFLACFFGFLMSMLTCEKQLRLARSRAFCGKHLEFSNTLGCLFSDFLLTLCFLINTIIISQPNVFSNVNGENGSKCQRQPRGHCSLGMDYLFL